MKTTNEIHNYLDCISGKISRNDAMNIQEVTDISNLNIEIPEEKSGIEMLEELADSYCQECGVDLSDRRSDDPSFCKDCYSREMNLENRFQAQREN